MMKDLLNEEEKKGTRIPKSARQYYHKIVPLVYTLGPLNSWGLIKKMAFFVAGWFRPVPREITGPHHLQLWAVKTTALACENLMLAFRAYGYDTCAMEGYDSSRVKKLLKLPKDAVTVMVISAGKRSPKGIFGPQLRFSSDLFIKKI
jgi:nitroreductase